MTRRGQSGGGEFKGSDQHGRIALFDTSDLQHAGVEWRQSAESLKSLFENMATGFLVLSPQMEIIQMNKQMQTWYPSIDPSKRPLCYRMFNEPAAGAVCTGCPTRLTLQDGKIHEAVLERSVGDKTRHLRIASSPVRNADGMIAAVIESIEDVTESYHVNAQIRNLTQKLISAQEIERLMISRELHDNLAQEIVAAKMICDNLLGGFGAEGVSPEKAVEKVAAILAQCISDIRHLSYDLRPPGLKQFGLVETLRQYAVDFADTFELQVDFQASGFEKIELDDDQSINLFRLVQEGLNNVMKHAAASRVSIRMLAAHPNVILRIEDNGVGFDVAKRQATITREKKLGLRSMQERVELLNGVMTIKSKPGHGTRLFVKLPVAR